MSTALTNVKGLAKFNRAALFTAAYAVAAQALRRILQRWGPKEFIAATPERQQRTVLYLLSLVNVIVTVAPFVLGAPRNWRVFGNLVPGPYASITRTGQPRFPADPAAVATTTRMTSARGPDLTERTPQRPPSTASIADALEGRSSPAVPTNGGPRWSQRTLSTDGPPSASVLVDRTHHDEDGTPHYDAAEAAAEYTNASWATDAITGYLCHDLLAILPSWREYPAEIFHHLAGLVCGVSSILTMRRVFPFIGVFFTAEASTLFLNLMWLTKEYPQTLAGLVPNADARQMLQERVLPLSFAATFATVRGMLFPFMKVKLFLSPVQVPATATRPARESNCLDEMIGKPARMSLFALQVLQWYWLALILRKVSTAQLFQRR